MWLHTGGSLLHGLTPEVVLVLFESQPVVVSEAYSKADFCPFWWVLLPQLFLAFILNKNHLNGRTHVLT